MTDLMCGIGLLLTLPIMVLVFFVDNRLAEIRDALRDIRDEFESYMDERKEGE